MRTFKLSLVSVINKSFPNFWRVQCRSYSSVFIRLHINFCCGWRCWVSHGNAISLLVKLRIKSVPSGCSNQKLVLRYSRFPSKLMIIINIILDYVWCINYWNVCVQGSDVKWYRYLITFNGSISYVVGKRDRILGVVIFIFDMRMLWECLLCIYWDCRAGSH